LDRMWTGTSRTSGLPLEGASASDTVVGLARGSQGLRPHGAGAPHVPPHEGTFLSRRRNVVTLRLLRFENCRAGTRYNGAGSGYSASERSGDRGENSPAVARL